MKIINVTISEEGDISVDMDGFQGESCAQEIERFLRILEGEGITAKQKTVTRKFSQNTVPVRQRIST